MSGFTDEVDWHNSAQETSWLRILLVMDHFVVAFALIRHGAALATTKVPVRLKSILFRYFGTRSGRASQDSRDTI